MRCIVFLSLDSSLKNEKRPHLIDLVDDLDIEFVCEPTESGLHLIEGSPADIEILKFMTYPHYIVMEDFDAPTTIH